MKKLKFLGAMLATTFGVLCLSFSPLKASAQYGGNYNQSYMHGYNSMNYGSSYDYPGSSRYMRNYFPGMIRVTYPRTVYLIDASNSANQLNIINATRGGSTTAAYITVSPDVYNRVVDDYNELGVASIRVDLQSDIVTFMTVNGTFSTYPINISWQ